VKYEVTLRRTATGDEHKRRVFAPDKETAGKVAIARARKVLPTMAERKYERYEVVACEPIGGRPRARGA
jgi:hypothetical protein